MTEPSETLRVEAPNPGASREATNQLVEALLADQAARWRRLERVPVEVYLREQPALADHPEAVLDLIYHEVVLRETVGETPLVQEYVRRFPHLARQLQAQFDFDGAILASAGAAPTPDHGLVQGEPGPPSALSTGADPSIRVPGYEILEELGRGGMGVVYKARELQLNRLVALKMILHSDYASADQMRRFRAEAEAVAGLQHPNIVQIHMIGEHDGLPYFALEYCAGGTLQQQLAGQPQQPAVAARLLETLARAMGAAHAKHIIHRDLKPANVLLTEDGTARISDFGLAKKLDVAGHTHTGAVMGTPSYMAPEQARGDSQTLTAACDIYALGAILYDCLTGRPPFKAATAMDTVLQVLHQEPVPPRHLNAQVPRDLETICLTCLRKEPAKRYATALALADDLRRFQLGEPIQARPVDAFERAVRWVRRRQTSVAVAVALLLLTAVGLGISTLLLGQEQRRTAQARKERALAQVDQLRTADPAAVPNILENLEANRADVLPRLQELWQDKDHAKGTRQQRMRVGLALLASEPETVKDELLAWLLDTDDPRELELTRDVLAPHGETLKDRLWATYDQTTKPPVRFRALVALARYDPDNPGWGAAAPETLEGWLRADPLFLGVLTRALRPARAHLLGPLIAVAKGRNEALKDKRFEAASVLADYAANQPETLVDLLAEADERQFALLFPKVQAHGEQALVLLRQEMKRVTRWYRPRLPDAERDSLASRQANVAAALLRLKQEEAVWPLLQPSPDPTRRTYLTLRLATRGVEAATLVARLESEPEVSERRALVSALGEYDERQLPAQLRQRLLPRLLTWYREDPDPGVHAAIDWLLRQKMDGSRPRPLDWGQAKALEAIDAELRVRGKPAEGRRWSINSQGQTMVHFQGPVEFLMGSPPSESNRDNELLHRRRIERSFAIASKKVTVRDFEAAFHKPTSDQKKYGPDPDCPVLSLRWYDAAMYCRWLSDKEGFDEEDMCYPKIDEIRKCSDGKTTLKLPADYLSRKGYRLPTEAEWEYACRAGTLTAHSYGDGGEELLSVYAWYMRNSENRAWPVGQKRPNDFGMFDMHGNTLDWCHEAYYKYQIGREGFTLDKEDNKDIIDTNNHIMRGSQFGNLASLVRSARRSFYRPSIQSLAGGVRVARTL
jgi:formylglycine-generating enzyme required for sulfatase activity/tRNA A-37 threonylcarbamoyl transferase component Bud32